MSSPLPETRTFSAAPLMVDPALFEEAAITPDTRAINAGIVKALGAIPDRWVFPMAVLRKLRLEGKGPFPLAPESPYAQVIEIDGPHGPVPLRILTPPTPPKGVYLHIHGGGWCLGSARENDGLNHRFVERTGFAVVSVEYRLAPEEPWPAGPDDCEAAALWLVREGDPLRHRPLRHRRRIGGGEPLRLDPAAAARQARAHAVPRRQPHRRRL